MAECSCPTFAFCVRLQLSAPLPASCLLQRQPIQLGGCCSVVPSGDLAASFLLPSSGGLLLGDQGVHVRVFAFPCLCFNPESELLCDPRWLEMSDVVGGTRPRDAGAGVVEVLHPVGCCLGQREASRTRARGEFAAHPVSLQGLASVFASPARTVRRAAAPFRLLVTSFAPSRRAGRRARCWPAAESGVRWAALLGRRPCAGEVDGWPLCWRSGGQTGWLEPEAQGLCRTSRCSGGLPWPWLLVLCLSVQQAAPGCCQVPCWWSFPAALWTVGWWHGDRVMGSTFRLAGCLGGATWWLLGELGRRSVLSPTLTELLRGAMGGHGPRQQAAWSVGAQGQETRVSRGCLPDCALGLVAVSAATERVMWPCCCVQMLRFRSSLPGCRQSRAEVREGWLLWRS